MFKSRLRSRFFFAQTETQRFLNHKRFRIYILAVLMS